MYKSKASQAAALWNKASRARINTRQRELYKLSPTKKIESAKKWSVKNKETVKNNDRLKRKNNPIKYRALSNAAVRKYQATKLRRTPKWLSKEQLQEIKEHYILAAELSWLSDSGLEVDHIVPLQGKNVSGLHVPWNLQVISAYENQSKGNR